MPTHDALLDAATEIALAAGRVLKERFHEKRTITLKGPVNLVTDADTAAEAAALAVLRERFPDHAVLAEESGAAGSAPYRWYIDPLDGTTNYAHGVPHFSVSVACAENGAIVAGVVLDPMRGELFRARKGGGSTLGGAPIHVSGESELEKSLLTTGFPYDLRRRAEQLLGHFGDFTRAALATRRFGSAALDLAWVAAGRFDGFWESGLAPWDVAAGSLLVTEAGGTVSDYAGGPLRLDGGELVAGNAALAAAMRRVIATAPARPAAPSPA